MLSVSNDYTCVPSGTALTLRRKHPIGKKRICSSISEKINKDIFSGKKDRPRKYVKLEQEVLTETQSQKIQQQLPTPPATMPPLAPIGVSSPFPASNISDIQCLDDFSSESIHSFIS